MEQMEDVGQKSLYAILHREINGENPAVQVIRQSVLHHISNLVRPNQFIFEIPPVHTVIGGYTKSE